MKTANDKGYEVLELGGPLMSHLISKSSLLLFLSSFIIQSCTLSIPNKVQTEYSNLTEEIDFNYHIKPILSDRCFQCHGPDSKTRKAGLRLDIEEIALIPVSKNSLTLCGAA